MKRKINSSKVSIIKNNLIGKKIDRIEKSFEIMISRSLTDLERKTRETISSCRIFFLLLRSKLSVVGFFVDF